MRRLVLLVLGLVVAWLATPGPSFAAPTPSTTAQAYAYDSGFVSCVVQNTSTERGPPIAYDDPQGSAAVDDSSYGASARHHTAALGPTTSYTAPCRLVRRDNRGATTGSKIQSIGGDLSALVVSQVAAKTGPRLGTAVPNIADVRSLIPKGENLNTWGRQIWGVGEDGAESLIGTRSASCPGSPA